MWFMYVVKCSDGTLYTGITTDVRRRLHEHNHTKRGARYTRSRRPVSLVCTFVCDNRSQALQSEWRFKQLTRPQKDHAISERIFELLNLNPGM